MTTDQLRSELPAVAFDYTDLARANIIHTIPVGMSGTVWVIGGGGGPWSIPTRVMVVRPVRYVMG
jgi:hypothetical protein